MIYALISYCITSFIFFVVLQKRKSIFFAFPKLKITSSGISFKSNSRHRINIEKSKIMQIGNDVYLKRNNNVITIKNISNLYLKKDYLYFNANGKCSIIFPCSRLERYFNISINSHMFNFENIKQNTLAAMLNNIFELKKCVELKKYLRLVLNILKINITKSGVTIKQNKLKLPYTLEYCTNNTKKVVHVNN